MDKGKTTEDRAIEEMPSFLAATIERNEALRFTALGLLDKARARIEDIAAQPPADAVAAALAALPPLHLAARSLLAARGIRSFNARASFSLLRILYPASLPDSLVTRLAQIQSLTLQGGEAIKTARFFVDLAGKLLNKPA
jgi:hypothetical protein